MQKYLAFTYFQLFHPTYFFVNNPSWGTGKVSSMGQNNIGFKKVCSERDVNSGQITMKCTLISKNCWTEIWFLWRAKEPWQKEIWLKMRWKQRKGFQGGYVYQPKTGLYISKKWENNFLRNPKIASVWESWEGGEGGGVTRYISNILTKIDRSRPK